MKFKIQFPRHTSYFSSAQRPVAAVPGGMERNASTVLGSCGQHWFG